MANLRQAVSLPAPRLDFWLTCLLLYDVPASFLIGGTTEFRWKLTAMLDLNYQRSVLGYHGCDADVVAKVLAGDDTLTQSEQGYDWLGPGVYFWEHGPQRAYDWAVEESRRNPDKITTPAVLGAIINLGQCFDFLDIPNTRLLQSLYPEFKRVIVETGKRMPENRSTGRGDRDKVLRFLDCAVIKFALDKLAEAGRVYHTARGAFFEGGEAFPGAGIMLKSHIQIAVREPSCIVGFFRPSRKSYAAESG